MGPATRTIGVLPWSGAGGFEPPFGHLLGGLPRGGLRELLEALRRVLEELEASDDPCQRGELGTRVPQLHADDLRGAFPALLAACAVYAPTTPPPQAVSLSRARGSRAFGRGTIAGEGGDVRSTAHRRTSGRRGVSSDARKGVGVGTVAELWRYPVKSMLGSPVDELLVTERGALGDRAWALRVRSRGTTLPRTATVRPLNLRKVRPRCLNPWPEWGREDSNLRRLSRRVYSPFPLAARAHPQGRPL